MNTELLAGIGFVTIMILVIFAVCGVVWVVLTISDTNETANEILQELKKRKGKK